MLILSFILVKYVHIYYMYLIIIYEKCRPESTPPSLLSSELATPQQISAILLTDGMLNNPADELKKLKVYNFI